LLSLSPSDAYEKLHIYHVQKLDPSLVEQFKQKDNSESHSVSNSVISTLEKMLLDRGISIDE